MSISENSDYQKSFLFGEATAEQRAQCYKLAAIAFKHPLSTPDFLQREEFLSSLPLTCGSGSWIWCLASHNDPMKILATCRTLHRDLFVVDTAGLQEKQGYCISSVITHPEYRKKGLASNLLKNVSDWMDGDGQAAASFLYTSVESVSSIGFNFCQIESAH
jgi:GNAT superfamily N-acetyltransferase